MYLCQKKGMTRASPFPVSSQICPPFALTHNIGTVVPEVPFPRLPRQLALG